MVFYHQNLCVYETWMYFYGFKLAMGKQWLHRINVMRMYQHFKVNFNF